MSDTQFPTIQLPEGQIKCHEGHKVVVVAYGNDANFSLECEDCNEVLADFDAPTDPADKLQSDGYYALRSHFGHDIQVVGEEVLCKTCSCLIATEKIQKTVLRGRPTKEDGKKHLISTRLSDDELATFDLERGSMSSCKYARAKITGTDNKEQLERLEKAISLLKEFTITKKTSPETVTYAYGVKTATKAQELLTELGC